MKNPTGSNKKKILVFAVGYLVLFVLAVLGYILNIIQLAGANTLGGMEVIRAAGLFLVPVGSILGFF